MSATVIKSPGNLLKSRLHTGDDDAPLMSKSLLREAEQAVSEYQDLFLDWIGETIGQLRAQIRAAELPGGDSSSSLREQFRLAFEIAGLGATFGYPLLSRVGSSMVELLDGRETATPLLTGTLGVHADALTLIYNNRIRGEGDENSQALIADLDKAVQRVHEEDAKLGHTAPEPPTAE